mgnify:CR=1 FL=1
MRYLLKMMYDGTRYSGYQRQANADTVGERLLTALQTLFGQVEHMAGCSRTDCGVHALMFCVSFDAAQERDSQGTAARASSIYIRFEILHCEIRFMIDMFLQYLMHWIFNS